MENKTKNAYLNEGQKETTGSDTVERGVRPPASKKIIVIDTCLICPIIEKCKAWKKLEKRQRFYLTLSPNVSKFILKGCPLPYGDDKLGTFEGV